MTKEHVQTIHYDIDMLQYCFGRMRRRQWADTGDQNLCLEGFLLHYRNLIEFFRSHGGGLRADKHEEWSPRPLSDDEVKSITGTKPLDDYQKLISRYLSHCDIIRAEKDKRWKPAEMYAGIEPLVTNFKTLFPPVAAQKSPLIFGNPLDGASTTTVIWPGKNRRPG